MKGIDLKSLEKKSLSKFIPDLHGRDDFDYEQVPTECIRCKGNDSGYKYRFYGETEWVTYKPSKQCKECDLADHLTQSQKDHLQQVNDSLSNRYWFLPKDLEVAGFKTFKRTNSVTSNGANICIDYVKRFKENQPDKRYNLLIMGNPGTGKSHLSVAIARTLKASGFTVGFLTTGKLLSLIKETYSKGAARTENDIFEDIAKLDLLVLDDLASEQGTRDEFSWTKSKLFEIVNTRISKPTIYTTNFNDLNIAEAVGERVVSRLYNNSKFIDMFTDDYRKNFKVV
jgi:DNA replication protein DnaC